MSKMRTAAYRSNRVFALSLDTNGRVRDLISGDSPSVNTSTWATGIQRYGDGTYLHADAAANYMAFANNSRFLLGNGTQNFHMGAWVRLTSATGFRTICAVDQDNDSIRRFTFRARNNSAQPLFYFRDGTNPGLALLGPSAVTTAGIWYYICVQRVGNVYTCYVDGVAGTPITYTTPIVLHATNPFTIGRVTTSTSYLLNGYIQGLEISEPGTLLDVYGGKRPLR